MKHQLATAEMACRDAERLCADAWDRPTVEWIGTYFAYSRSIDRLAEMAHAARKAGILP